MRTSGNTPASHPVDFVKVKCTLLVRVIAISTIKMKCRRTFFARYIATLCIFVRVARHGTIEIASDLSLPSSSTSL